MLLIVRVCDYFICLVSQNIVGESYSSKALLYYSGWQVTLPIAPYQSLVIIQNWLDRDSIGLKGVMLL